MKRAWKIESGFDQYKYDDYNIDKLQNRQFNNKADPDKMQNL